MYHLTKVRMPRRTKFRTVLSFAVADATDAGDPALKMPGWTGLSPLPRDGELGFARRFCTFSWLFH